MPGTWVRVYHRRDGCTAPPPWSIHEKLRRTRSNSKKFLCESRNKLNVCFVLKKKHFFPLDMNWVLIYKKRKTEEENLRNLRNVFCTLSFVFPLVSSDLGLISRFLSPSHHTHSSIIFPHPLHQPGFPHRKIKKEYENFHLRLLYLFGWSSAASAAPRRRRRQRPVTASPRRIIILTSLIQGEVSSFLKDLWISSTGAAEPP